MKTRRCSPFILSHVDCSPSDERNARQLVAAQYSRAQYDLNLSYKLMRKKLSDDIRAAVVFTCKANVNDIKTILCRKY